MKASNEHVKVLRLFSQDGGLVTVIAAPAGSVGYATPGSDEFVVGEPTPCVMLQADMVPLHTVQEVRALAMFLKRCVGWLEDQLDEH